MIVERVGDRVIDREEAGRRAGEWRARGERVALAVLGFDLLGAADVRYLEAARRLADRLIVALRGDGDRVASEETGGPVLGRRARTLLAAGLEAVDAVVPLADAGAAPISDLIDRVRPGIAARRGDDGAWSEAEAAAASARGVELIVIPAEPRPGDADPRP